MKKAEAAPAHIAPAHIYVVDDAAAVRSAVCRMLGREGFHASGFAKSSSFLAAVRRRRPDCIILGIHMQGRSGVDILGELRTRNCTAPLFIISGHNDMGMAAEALRRGALDVIKRPFDAAALIALVRDVVAQASGYKGDAPAAPADAAQFPWIDLLTPREHEVLGLITAGASNKEAGRRLGISPRTVEVHRARIMEKLGARNTVDLVHIVLSQRG